jgi:magnesium-transporting ATPase (P-type)
MHEGGEPKMGSTVVRGETEATVAYTGKDTFLGKTAAMLQVSGLGCKKNTHTNTHTHTVIRKEVTDSRL